MRWRFFTRKDGGDSETVQRKFNSDPETAGKGDQIRGKKVELRPNVTAIVTKIETHIRDIWKFAQAQQFRFMLRKEINGIGCLRLQIAVSGADIETEAAVPVFLRPVANFPPVMNAIGLKATVGEKIIDLEILTPCMKNAAGHKEK